MDTDALDSRRSLSSLSGNGNDNFINRLKESFLAKYERLNSRVYDIQRAIGKVYSEYFTMPAALFFAMSAGVCMGFTGDDCYGKVPFSSPLFWCLSLLTLFFFFQTFIMIRLTIGRMSRLITVAICGHYLAYQAYGFWSINYIETAAQKISSVSAGQVSDFVRDVVPFTAGAGVCKPYAYANIPYGHAWIIIPAIAWIMICFFWMDGGETE